MRMLATQSRNSTTTGGQGLRQRRNTRHAIRRYDKQGKDGLTHAAHGKDSSSA